LESEIKEYQLEKRYVQKSGRTIHVIVRVILLADLDGKDQLLAQVIDITRLKKVEDILKIKNLELLEGNINLEKTNLELERKNMELDRFIYSASHDLRAPLLSLKGLINITKMEIGDTNKMYFDLMEKSIDKLDNFIGEIIQFSANESTQIHEEHVPDFESVIKENYERLRYSIGADNISLIINSTIDQSFIIDRQRLEIILSNLLSNGIKYHDPQKQKQFIEINSCIEGNMLNIDVKDNGIGIPDNRQDRVFDFFYRAHDHSFGAGLGLYIVRQTIKKLNGRISLLSKVGIGSTFLIELPVRFDIDQKIVA
jgi:signal transduction histidine kinase